MIWLLVSYIAFFAVSQGAVIWVYIGEVFPNRVRSKGQSLGSSSHWIMNAIIAYTFPQVAKSSGAYPFMFFAAMMVVQFFVVLFVLSGNQGRHAGTDAAAPGNRLDSPRAKIARQSGLWAAFLAVPEVAMSGRKMAGFMVAITILIVSLALTL